MEEKRDSQKKYTSFRSDSLVHVKDILPFPWIVGQHSGSQCVQSREYLLWHLFWLNDFHEVLILGGIRFKILILEYT